MTKKKIKDDRARVWSFIVYPESAPENWREIIDEYHIKWIESPLHDKDLNPDGTFKKPHWHIILIFDGNKSYSQILEITNKINSPIPQKVASIVGMVRYLIHLDNPEKYQYSRDDIIAHGGADLFSYLEPSKSEKLIVMKEMIDFIYENHIDNYADFLMICIETSDDWFDIAINYNTFAITKAIEGVWKRHREIKDKYEK